MQLHKLCLLVLTVALQHCSKSKRCEYSSPPASLFFLIKKDGSRLPDAVLENTRIFYMENGNRKQLTDLVRATDEGHALGVLTSRLIGVISADQHLKTFFIEYPAYSTDTLYVAYSPPGRDNNCVYTRDQVLFNNELITPELVISTQQVYVFNK